MHRTQISLQEHQYEGLIDQAQRQGISLSEPIRRLVDDYLHSQPERVSAIARLAGTAQGDGQFIGRNHDRYLYGKQDQ